MKRTIWFYCLLCALSCWPGCRLTAQTFPAVSDDTTENWYYIVFNSADDIVAAKGEGEIAVVAIPTGRDAQLWKVEGTATAGYTLTSKSGQRLYVNPATYSTNLRTAAAPAAGTRFNLTPNGAGFEIIPTEAPSLSMNPWGGNSVGALLALYYKNDPNAIVRFVPEAEMADGPAVSVIPYPASVTATDGRFDMKTLTAIVCTDAEAKAPAEAFAAGLKAAAGIAPVVTDDAATTGVTLHMAADATMKDEALRLGGFHLEPDRHRG